jgi:hypothetical protein
MTEKSVAEIVSRQCYGKSARLDAPENKDNKEFHAGYLLGGQAKCDQTGWWQIDHEYVRRGLPHHESEEGKAFEEWKRGYWAGLFTRLENEMTIGVNRK